MKHFLKHNMWLRNAFYSNSVPLYAQFFAATHVFHMIGVDKPLPKDPSIRESLLRTAAMCSIVLYERTPPAVTGVDGGTFQFVANPFPHSDVLPPRKHVKM
mmetsp:Transcript_17452/g.19873  ORF Transcript_17452/g.19873 Transcript_17452/m.19873 type:complete len:101 (+) Transcript_17452:2-304(+)